MAPGHPDVKCYSATVKAGSLSPTTYYWIPEAWGNTSSWASGGGPCRHATSVALTADLARTWAVAHPGTLPDGEVLAVSLPLQYGIHRPWVYTVDAEVIPHLLWHLDHERTTGVAAGTMSRFLSQSPRAARSHSVKPEAQTPGVGKGTTASGRPTEASRATGPEEARGTARGHEARQRGTPPATTKADGQVPSSNGRRVPQTRRARTTRNEPRQEDRFQATPAAVWTDVCAPGSKPSPCQQRNSRRLDGRVRALRVPSPCRLRIAAVLIDE